MSASEALSTVRDPSRAARRDTDKGTRAHTAVQVSERAALVALEDERVWRLATDQGWTVAHEAALRHEAAAVAVLDEAALARAANERAYTVAHVAAGWHPAAARRAVCDPRLRALKDDQGRTVAQEAAICDVGVARWALHHEAVGELTQRDGASVTYFALQKHPELAAWASEHLPGALDAPGPNGTTAAWAAVRHSVGVCSLLLAERWDEENDDGVSLMEWAVERFEPAARAVLRDPAFDTRRVSTGELVCEWAIKHHRSAARLVVTAPAVTRRVATRRVSGGLSLIHAVVERYETVAATALQDERLRSLTDASGRTVARRAMGHHAGRLIGRVRRAYASEGPPPDWARAAWEAHLSNDPDQAIGHLQETRGSARTGLVRDALRHPDTTVREAVLHALGREGIAPSGSGRGR